MLFLSAEITEEKKTLINNRNKHLPIQSQQ